MIQPISALLLGNHQVREITCRLARATAFIQSATYFAGKLNDESDLLTQQQRAELWAGIRHDIGLSEIHRCFRVTSLPLSTIWRNAAGRAKKPFCPPAFSAIRGVLRLGNNRQAVTDYIRHNFGQRR